MDRNARSRILRLGPALTPYCLCPEGSEDENAAISVVQHIWGLAEAIAPPLRWPAARVDVPMFADAMLEFARSSRAYRAANGSGLPGGRGDSASTLS